MKIYLDTSVINGNIADDSPWIREATRNFFLMASKPPYTLYLSELVIDEIKNTSNLTRRAHLEATIDKYSFEILLVNQEAQSLARQYVQQKIFPEKYFPDALHVATAVIHAIPILVSWNFQHMVKHKIREQVNLANQNLGYQNIDICSPQEV